MTMTEDELTKALRIIRIETGCDEDHAFYCLHALLVLIEGDT